MPARCLPRDGKENVPQFAIVAKYSDALDSTFVEHLAVLRSNEHLSFGTQGVKVWQMGPPLVAGEVSREAALSVHNKDATCMIHLYGVVELSAQDIEAIETWLVELDKESRPPPTTGYMNHYIISPPMKWVTAEGGIRLYRRYSCAGFVLDCYRSFGVRLIDDSREENIPEVQPVTLASFYGPHVLSERIRTKLGIPGNGPWRITLAGYVIHALNRANEVIRTSCHIPISIAEKDFPLKSPPARDTKIA